MPNAAPRSVLLLALLVAGAAQAAPTRLTASGQTVSTAEDTAVAITLSGSSTNAGTLTYTIDTSTPRTRGTVSCASQSCTYTPSANYNGTDRFWFKVTSGSSSSSWAVVTVNVSAVNDPPTANTISSSTNEDAARIIGLSGSDVEYASLSYQLVSSPTRGTATLSGTAVTYTPSPDQNGADSFTYRAWDGAAWSSPATVSVTVNPVADRPVAADLAVSAAEDTAVTFTLPASDVDGDALTPNFLAAVLTGSTYTTLTEAHGTFTVSGLTVTYTPPAGWSGTDTFTYTVSDGIFTSPTAGTVTVDVAAVNDAPVAEDAFARAADGDPAHLVLAATDADGDALTYRIVSGPRQGTATIWNGNKVVYRPSASATGTDTFTFRANDGTADSATATVTLALEAGVAGFPVDELPVDDGVVVDVTDDGNVVLELPGALDGCEETWSNQPRVPATLDGLSIGNVGLVAGHYDTLSCGYAAYQPEYSSIHLIVPTGDGTFEARLLDQGENVQAPGVYLDDGSLLFTTVGGADLSGGLVRYSAGSATSDTAIRTMWAEPLSAGSDSSPHYDPASGVTVIASTVVPETCLGAEGDDCGAMASVDVAGNTLDIVDEADGHHAWGSAGCIDIYGTRVCGFGPGSDASGADNQDLDACTLATLADLPTPPGANGVVDVTLALDTVVDLGGAGCTPVAGLESSFVNGGLVSDGTWLYAVALGSDDTDDYTRVYQLDTDLTVQQVFEIPAGFDHSLMNGFHNTLLVGADGTLYLTGTVDVLSTTQYAVVGIDPASGEVWLVASELVAHDNLYGTGHLYVDANGDEVIAYAVGGTGVVTRLSDGALLDAYTLGAAGGDYVAAPVLIDDGDGQPDGLMFISTDNVVTIVPDTGLTDDTSAPWPGPRGGGFMQARVE